MGGLSDAPDHERITYSVVGGIYAPLLVALCVVCVVRVQERFAAVEPEHRSLPDGLKALRQNRPFWILLSAYTLGTLAFNLAGSLLLYYVRYVLDSDRADVFLVIYLLSGIVCLPFWIWVSERLGKRNTWMIGMATYACGGIAIFFLGAGDEAIYAVLCFVTGMTFGPTVAIPSSMQADTIDYDEFLTGERREGIFVGMWSVVRKMAAAIGVGIALPLLSASGYTPNAPQSRLDQIDPARAVRRRSDRLQPGRHSGRVKVPDRSGAPRPRSARLSQPDRSKLRGRVNQFTGPS